MEEYLSTGRVARIFGVTSATIRRWLDERKFPGAVQINGVWRIPVSDVKTLAETKVG